MALTGGIPLGSQFRFTAGLSLDMREVVANITARNALESGIRFEGLTVYVISEQKFYALKGGILDANWFELPQTPGVVVVADEAARLAIASDDRYEGMLVYQIDAQKNYQLVGGITDGDWQELQTSGGGSGGTGKNYFVDSAMDRNLDNVFANNNLLTRTVASSAGLVTEGTDTINLTAHGFRERNQIQFFGNIGGLTNEAFYYIRNSTTNSFQLSLTVDGSPVDLTSDGTGDQIFSRYYDNGLSGVATGIVLSIEEATPRSNLGSLKVTKPAATNAMGDVITFSTKRIDKTHRGKRLNFRTYIEMFAGYDPDAGAAGEKSRWTLKAWDVTNSRELLIDSPIIPAAFSGELLRSVYTLSTTEEINFSISITDFTGATGEVYLGEISLSPDVLVPGFIGSDWQSYTPSVSASLGTISTVSAHWRRVGDSMEIRGRFVSGTLTSARLEIGLPTGYVIDSSKLSSNGGLIGGFTTNNTSASYSYIAIANGGASWFGAGVKTVNTTNQFAFVNSTDILSNGNTLVFDVSVPILGWSAGAVFSTTEMLNKGTRFRASRNGTNQTGIAPNNSAIKLLFNSNASSLDYGGLYYDATNSRFIVPQRDVYSLKASAFINSTNVLASRYSMLIYINGSEGISGQSVVGTVGASMPLTVSAPDILLQAGDIIEVYLYGAGNNSSSTLTMDGSARLSSFSAQQLFDPTSFSVYGETKYYESKNTSLTAYAITASQFGDLTSLILPNGEYDMGFAVDFNSNGTTSTTDIIAGIGTASGTSSTGLDFGDTRASAVKLTTSGSIQTLTLSGINKVVPPWGQTFYLKGYANTSTTNLRVAYKIWARKVK